MQTANNFSQVSGSGSFFACLSFPHMNKRILLSLSLLTACVAAARADENLFGYTYMADVLAKGKWELEQWATARIGKESGDFLGTDLRTEIEYGFTDRLMGSLFFHYNYFYAHDAMATSGPLDNKNSFNVNGVSSEWKYQVLSPYKDSFGFALYLEPGYSVIERATGERHQEFELEAKLIFEKHWFDDTLIGTFNYTLEPEWARPDNHDSYSTNLKMEWGTGLAYRIAPRWHAGLETRVQTEYADANLNNSEYVSVFAGPCLHYGADRWWATLTVLPQVWGWPNSHGTGSLALDDNERLEVRLKVGYNF
jgi:hypothetical protein